MIKLEIIKRNKIRRAGCGGGEEAREAAEKQEAVRLRN